MQEEASVGPLDEQGLAQTLAASVRYLAFAGMGAALLLHPGNRTQLEHRPT